MEKYRLYLLLLLFPPPSSFPFPNRIRYGWFRIAPQRRTRGYSSLWPQGTVTELPSGTSLEPPQNPKSGIQNPKFPNPKSKLFRPDFGDFGDFGFWILDRYVAFLYMRPPPPQISGILDFGFWILDLGFWILDFGFRILDFGFWISDFAFWILDFGFRILDFGFWWGGVFADIFWMLHNIRITVHADPGRRILETSATALCSTTGIAFAITRDVLTFLCLFLDLFLHSRFSTFCPWQNKAFTVLRFFVDC